MFPINVVALWFVSNQPSLCKKDRTPPVDSAFHHVLKWFCWTIVLSQDRNSSSLFCFLVFWFCGDFGGLHQKHYYFSSLVSNSAFTPTCQSHCAVCVSLLLAVLKRDDCILQGFTSVLYFSQFHLIWLSQLRTNKTLFSCRISPT